ncbi:hypothetical protein BAU15_06460 [Enterococcus sp. JM4C]|uniref:hypothetical protein n=1 Tax=Candidatus Enterococcus huntleyi TaxID=1857217 RepID=UPI001379982C|nr:hypothetical protein [Enterococcus sp. JM4C]KAF1297185.1 hypothetical protein BAU15_06460 [Enterococcus sp. JM4C]
MMKFEYKKWLKSYKTLVLLSLTFLLLTFFFAHVTQKEKQVRANYIISIEDTFYDLVALSDQAAAAPTDEMTETQI